MNLVCILSLTNSCTSNISLTTNRIAVVVPILFGTKEFSLVQCEQTLYMIFTSSMYVIFVVIISIPHLYKFVQVQPYEMQFG